MYFAREDFNFVRLITIIYYTYALRFCRRNRQEFQQLNIYDAAVLQASNYDHQLPTKIFIHGFTMSALDDRVLKLRDGTFSVVTAYAFTSFVLQTVERMHKKKCRQVMCRQVYIFNCSVPRSRGLQLYRRRLEALGPRDAARLLQRSRQSGSSWSIHRRNDSLLDRTRL